MMNVVIYRRTQIVNLLGDVARRLENFVTRQPENSWDTGFTKYTQENYALFLSSERRPFP